MIVVMNSSATEENVKNVENIITSAGLHVHLSKGEETTIIGIVGDKTRVNTETLQAADGVEKIIQVTESYKLANRKFHPANTVIKVGGKDTDAVTIGGDQFVIMGGPCAVESYEEVKSAAECVKKSGAGMLRGGAYKPRTSPYSFQGLEEEGLKILHRVSRETGLPVISEVTSEEALKTAIPYLDMVQVGTRNMQNFALLKAVGKCGLPVMLKRGMAATIDEWLNAAEYILSSGNENVVLCERGIRTYETSTRNTLDISAVPVIKTKSHLPIIVDPSHASGVRAYIAPLSKAAAACGADGLMIETHPDPAKALSDGPQSLTFDMFENLCKDLTPLLSLQGRRL
ncbi:MAG: 3-deoxy-7-phosphoheptulonate synthase [Catonella sp.]|jgi:3-deoxy-7-phosphoheptulonate synthase|nr:3-deoxy-7-phosphoheptulonate synthase [Catonella sp.]MDY6356602.1 3-deoxy-7-phosphoheptulonate synthase [Catonella sp.]